jgi:hypothetical protein
MKLLVLSNVFGASDVVVDALGDSVKVVAKEVSISTDAMAAMASELMNAHSYDRLIVLTKDPIRAGIVLNKQEGINAAVCSSIEDLMLANEGGANAIIIKDANAKETMDMLGQMGSGSVLQGLRNIKLPTLPAKVRKEPATEERVATRAKIERHAEEPEKEAEGAVDEKEEKQLGQPRSGVVGKIKDYLGII